MKKLLVLLLTVGLLLSGCQSFGVWTPAAKTDMQKVSAAVAPLIGDAQKAVANIQQNYPFYLALAEGTLQAVGIPVPPGAAALAQGWLGVADTTLKIAAPVTVAIANNQAIPATDPGLLQLGIIQAQNVLPKETKAAMANPAVAALYQAYLAGQTNLPKPSPAAVPTN